MSRFCPNCGSEVAENTRFCGNCGNAISDATPGPGQVGERSDLPSSEATSGSRADRSPSGPVTPDLPPVPQAGPPPIDVPSPPPQGASGRGRRKWLVLGGGGCALVVGLGLLLILVLILAATCSSGGASSDGDSGGGGDASPGTDLEPSVAQGTVTYANGDPLEGADIYLYGLSTEAGSNVQANTQTDADGYYSLEVPDGEHQLWASMPVEYEGQTWTDFSLHPVDGEPMATPFDGADGAVRDFELRLSGPIPGDDPNYAFSYYGGYIELNYIEENTGATPQDAAFTFVLTPTAPLADDSEGKTITFERTYAQLSGNDDDSTLDTGGTLYDIPLGKYTLSGELALPDDSVVPLQFDENFADATDALEIIFKPEAASTRPDLVQINVYAAGASEGQEDTYVEPWNQ